MSVVKQYYGFKEKKEKVFCERLRKWRTKAKRLADFELVTEKNMPENTKRTT